MLKSKFWILSILFAALVVTSCKKDEDTPTPTPVNESMVLATFLESPDSPLGKYYVNTDMPAMIKAIDVNSLNLTGDIYIIDVRSDVAFGDGHIENAVNVPLADILTHIEGVDLSSYQKVAVVCYSGQSASWGTSILRNMGYDKAYTMKWGMCSWSDSTAGSWPSNISNAFATQFETSPFPKGAKGAMPTLSTGKTTGMEILRERVNAVLAEGFGAGKITNQAVFDNLADYYIVNYWKLDHYNVGHVPGAMQYTPKESIAYPVDLTTLPTDKPVVLYCYTGQTSAHLMAYLRLLGYDAKSLLFGCNGMIYDVMVAEGDMTVWKDTEIHDYPLVK